MKSILRISFLLLFSVLGMFVHAQDNNNSQPVISKEHLTRINAYLPSNLQINENGKVNQNFSRGQTHLLDSTHFFDWNSSISDWKMTKKTYNTIYNADGGLLEVLSYVDNSGTFTLAGKTNYVINNNRVTAFYMFNWNGSNWDSTATGTYRYNSNGYVTYYEEYNFSTTTLQRIPRFGYKYTYNSNNSFLSETIYTNNTATNTWKTHQQYLYSYDSNNNHVETLRSFADANTGQLVTNGKDSIFYNSNGQRNLILQYNINTANNSWDLTFQELFVTNAAGYDTERIRQMKDAASQSWVNQYRFTYAYNTNNRLILNQSENWGISSNWEVSYKEETNYTSFGEVSLVNIYSSAVTGTLQHVAELTYLYDNDNQLRRFEEKSYNPSLGTLLNYKARDEFRSLHTTTNTKERLTIEGVKFYPNPTKDNLVIEIPANLKELNIEVWNTQGILLKQQHQQNSSQFIIDLSAYPNGLYFIKVNNEEYNQTVIKVVKD